MKKISVIGIELTNICNLSKICRHCYGVTGLFDTEGLIKISDENIEMLIEEIPLIANGVTITGGEPTMYPEKVKDIISKLNLPWVLMTNGIIFRKDFHPNAVLVFIDPPDIRPGINPENVIKNVLKYKCNLSANTVISPEINLFYFYDLLKKASVELQKNGNHITEWKLNFVVNRGFATKNPKIFANWDLAFQHISTFLQLFFREKPFHLAIKGLFFTKNMGESNNPPQLDMNSNPCRDCFHRSIFTTVNAESKVQLCSIARNKSYTINDGLIDGYINVLNLPELNSLTYKDWKDCLGCKWINICGCGCPSLSESYGTGWTGKDIVQCEILNRLEKYILPVLPIEMQKAFFV